MKSPAKDCTSLTGAHHHLVVIIVIVIVIIIIPDFF